ncbi:nucleoside deaminase [Brevibacillus sp. B_LB10_24]|uniref:nucleoside deaminase n=1 Tax=Brevibacillus sp. B_LB10_24 TaxID=3380645 RepID=UPI0038BAA8F2
MNVTHQEWIDQAIELAYENTKEKRGKPFGAIIVKDGEVIAKGVNDVLQTHDPTAHAELQAIRAAGQKLGTSDLSDCQLYASGEPCPMCLGAIYLSNLKEVYYAYTAEEEAAAGLGTQYYYEQLALPKHQRDIQLQHVKTNAGDRDPFALWKKLGR